MRSCESGADEGPIGRSESLGIQAFEKLDSLAAADLADRVDGKASRGVFGVSDQRSKPGERDLLTGSPARGNRFSRPPAPHGTLNDG